MDESDAVIGEGEDDSVLVRHAGRAEQLAGRLFEIEPLAVPAQAVSADSPRSLSRGRNVRVGHDEPSAASVLDPLHPWILEVQCAPSARAGKDVAVLVVVPVGGGEDQDVGDVVDKTRTGAVARAVVVPHGPNEEVVGAGVMQDTGVEQRPIAAHGAGLDDGPVAQPPDQRRRD